MDILWPKQADYISPDQVIVTFADGKKVTLQPINRDAASTFLIGKPVESIKDEAVLKVVTIEGVATVEGQRGKFVANLFERGDEPRLRVRSIVFAGIKE